MRGQKRQIRYNTGALAPQNQSMEQDIMTKKVVYPYQLCAKS
jgi:hypothetical protein